MCATVRLLRLDRWIKLNPRKEVRFRTIPSGRDEAAEGCYWAYLDHELRDLTKLPSLIAPLPSAFSRI